jgi:GntR family transcriptional regulator
MTSSPLPGRAKLHRDSAVPLYVQIAEWLEREIAHGRLAPGSRLPSENELMARFGVSRITVRGALAKLARAGVAEVRQGKGSFVARRMVRHGLDRLTGFYDEMLNQGLRPEGELMAYRPATRSEAAGTPFAASHSAPMLLRRRYMLDATPFAVVHGLLLPECARLPRELAADHTIYQLLAALRLDVDRADVGIRGRAPGTAVSRLLGLPPRRQVLVMERTSYGKAGRPLEFSQFFIAPESYEFRLSMAGPVTIGSGIRCVDPAATAMALAD